MKNPRSILFIFFVVISLFTYSLKSAPLQAYIGKEDTLKKQFEAKGLVWPARYIYIPSFKYDSQLEVWVKNTQGEPYRLFKNYHVCMQSGTMGPKRFQGDFQVPEGLYHIDEFNPNSLYHLSMGLNYPNASDKILSDSESPGGDIYIHGSCVSVGCIALSDEAVEEVYTIANAAHANGMEFIPVHVFPVKYTVRGSAEYLSHLEKNNQTLKKFEDKLKLVYDYFNDKKQLPVVMINRKGEYIIN